MKDPRVVTIQKVSGTILANEFRHINKLNVFEKVLETVVKEQLEEYINSNHLLIPEQSGYRVGYFCESALNLVLTKWKEAFDVENTTIAVFLDLKRAFETISRPLLLKVLISFRIKGNELRWFESYLQDDMKRVLQHCDINLFADDTIIFISGSDHCDIVRKFNQDLDLLDGWLKHKKTQIES